MKIRSNFFGDCGRSVFTSQSRNWHCCSTFRSSEFFLAKFKWKELSSIRKADFASLDMHSKATEPVPHHTSKISASEILKLISLVNFPEIRMLKSDSRFLSVVGRRPKR